MNVGSTLHCLRRLGALNSLVLLGDMCILGIAVCNCCRRASIDHTSSVVSVEPKGVLGMLCRTSPYFLETFPTITFRSYKKALTIKLLQYESYGGTQLKKKGGAYLDSSPLAVNTSISRFTVRLSTSRDLGLVHNARADYPVFF